MKKLVGMSVLSFAATLLIALPAYAAESISGQAGSTAIDPGATYAGYMLRYVGDPAPAGYSHDYQWADPFLSCDPNTTATVFTGTVDVSEMAEGEVSMVGLLDQGYLESGAHGFQTGAYLYVHKNSATSVRIGPSDGNAGGEIVQAFGTYTIPADGVFNVDMSIYNGEITVTVDANTPIVDTYGDVGTSNYSHEEFEYGAVPGWDNYPPAANMYYNFSLTGCSAVVSDAEAPDVEITNPLDGDKVEGSVEIRGTVTDENPDHYWLVIQDSEGNTIAGPGVVYEDESFTDASLYTWDTTSVEDGVYTIKLEARDAYENKDGGSVQWIQVTVDNIHLKSEILMDSGVPGNGLETAPGLQKEFNPNSKAAENAGKKK